MNKNFLKLIMLSVVLQTTTLALAKKCVTPRKEQLCAVGTWLLNISALGPNGEVLFESFSVLSINEDCTVVDHSSSDLSQPLPGLPGGSYATIGLGNWRNLGGCDLEIFTTGVVNAKNPNDPNEGTPLFRQVLIAQQTIRRDGKDIVFEGEGVLRNFAVTDIELKNPIGPPMMARSFARKLTFKNLPR